MKGDTLEEVLALLTPCASLSILMKWLSLPSGSDTGDTVPLPPTSPVRSTQDPVHDTGVSDIVPINYSVNTTLVSLIAYNDDNCTWYSVYQDMKLKLSLNDICHVHRKQGSVECFVIWCLSATIDKPTLLAELCTTQSLCPKINLWKRMMSWKQSLHQFQIMKGSRQFNIQTNIRVSSKIVNLF